MECTIANCGKFIPIRPSLALVAAAMCVEAMPRPHIARPEHRAASSKQQAYAVRTAGAHVLPYRGSRIGCGDTIIPPFGTEANPGR
jgi:hypothetical protein